MGSSSQQISSLVDDIVSTGQNPALRKVLFELAQGSRPISLPPLLRLQQTKEHPRPASRTLRRTQAALALLRINLIQPQQR